MLALRPGRSHRKLGRRDPVLPARSGTGQYGGDGPAATGPGPASRVLRASGIGIEKRAAAVDRLSAVILLQSYLDSAASRAGDGR